MSYLRNVAIGLDQAVNAIIGGYPDETISARAYRCQWRIYPVIDWLFVWDRDHCQSSLAAERARLHAPPEEREPVTNLTKGEQ